MALQILKRGRPCTIAKIVEAKPLGELVLGVPYRNRQTVEHVSLPPAALAYARRAGCRLWVVRFDLLGECYSLPLADVERAGWLKPSDGKPEWFVALAQFNPTDWQQWEYVENVVTLNEHPEPEAKPTDGQQLGFDVLRLWKPL